MHGASLLRGCFVGGVSKPEQLRERGQTGVLQPDNCALVKTNQVAIRFDHKQTDELRIYAALAFGLDVSHDASTTTILWHGGSRCQDE
jgi:hypothetical protein